MILFGVDEAGRGALAGPVVAGAVYFSNGFVGEMFIDSKQTNEAQREKLFSIIEKDCEYGVGIVCAKLIDEIGIKKATEKAMNLAVSQITKIPGKILVDGRDKFQFSYPSQDIVRGDETESIISAASIVAKVMRDRIMKNEAKNFPEFLFENNMGYGTEVHRNLLEQEIYTKIHRKTYNPLKTILTQGRLF